MRTRHAAADATALLVVIIWGLNFPLLKLALGGFGLLPFTFLRFAGMLLLGWLVLALRPAGGIRREDWPRVAAAGLLGFTLYITGSLAGIHFSTAFSNALLIATAPLFVMMLLRLTGAEPVGLWRGLGAAVSLTGIAIFVGGATGGTLVGNLINLGAAFCYAAYSVVNRPLVTRYSATVVTAWTLTAGAVPILLLSGPSVMTQDWSRVTGVDWLILAWSITFPVYLAWTLWSWVQARVGVSRPAILMYLVPVIAGAVSWLLLRESFGPLKILGALVVIAGVALSRLPSRRPAAGEVAATNPRLAAN